VAATRIRARRNRHSPNVARVRTLPWLLAGVGGMVARAASAQSYVDTCVLFYKESDGRTQVIDPVFRLHQELGDTVGQLDLTLGYDSITGASPTGGYPSIDVTTSASGHTTASGNIPLANYKDQREALSAAYTRRFGAHLPTVDLSYSRENDYTARFASLADAWTMLEGRGTLHYGLSLSDDTVAPSNSQVEHPKRTASASLGWTWIVGERDVVDVSGSVTRLTGYLDDPYKVVPIGTASSNVTVPEHRPDSRRRVALVGRSAHHTEGDSVIKSSYRFYTDDWGIQAHTVEVEYSQRFDSDWIISPSVRLYLQSAATFYGALYAAPQELMSADYRLSKFWSAQAGLKVSRDFGSKLQLYGGVTYQSQSGLDRIDLTSASGLRRDDHEGGDVSTSVSAADLKVLTVSVGFVRRF
jgi:hypothetical protein